MSRSRWCGEYRYFYTSKRLIRLRREFTRAGNCTRSQVRGTASVCLLLLLCRICISPLVCLIEHQGSPPRTIVSQVCADMIPMNTQQVHTASGTAIGKAQADLEGTPTEPLLPPQVSGSYKVNERVIAGISAKAVLDLRLTSIQHSPFPRLKQ